MDEDTFSELTALERIEAPNTRKQKERKKYQL